MRWKRWRGVRRRAGGDPAGGDRGSGDRAGGDRGGGAFHAHGRYSSLGPTWDIVTLEPVTYPPEQRLGSRRRFRGPADLHAGNELGDGELTGGDDRNIQRRNEDRLHAEAGRPVPRRFGEVTAEDVKFSFERAAGKQKLYPDAKEEDVPSFATDWAALDQIRVTGKYSGEIVLTEPYVPISTITLSYASSGFVVSKKAVEQKGRAFGTSPLEPALSCCELGGGQGANRRALRGVCGG